MKIVTRSTLSGVQYLRCAIRSFAKRRRR